VATFDDVAAAADGLPEVARTGGAGSQSWAVAGKTFAWERQFSKADLRRYGDTAPPGGPILAVRVADLGEKEAVLAAGHPGIFTIEHFNRYPAVLVQLDAVDPAVLRDTVVDGWLACAPARLTRAYLRP